MTNGFLCTAACKPESQSKLAQSLPSKAFFFLSIQHSLAPLSTREPPRKLLLLEVQTKLASRHPCCGDVGRNNNDGGVDGLHFEDVM